MKLVCFPHYTCGGLLCDILNNTVSPIGKYGGLTSIQHSLGKIGDTKDVLLEFDYEKFLNVIPNNFNGWIGTHCWMGNYDCSQFDKVINVSVTTHRSKIYRWLRAYYLYFSKFSHWENLTGIELIDKQRETAKNYTVPFPALTRDNVLNIEFADVVENQPAFSKLIDAQDSGQYNGWKAFNSFLYDKDLWNNDIVKRFHEAEYEISSQQYYVYH